MSATSRALVVIAIGVSSASLQGQTLAVDPAVAPPGSRVQVTFTVPERMASGWIGLFRADVPHMGARDSDAYDITYAWLGDNNGRTLDFTAPEEPGRYEFRMFTGPYGTEIGTVRLSVEVGAGPTPSLELDRRAFAKGESVTVSVTHPGYPANAWIALVRASQPHANAPATDCCDLAFRYLSAVVGGRVTFTAPTEDGAYEFRMFDAYGGEEAAVAAFSVGASAVRPAPPPAAARSPAGTAGEISLRGAQIPPVPAATRQTLQARLGWNGPGDALIWAMHPGDMMHFDIDVRGPGPFTIAAACEDGCDGLGLAVVDGSDIVAASDVASGKPTVRFASPGNGTYQLTVGLERCPFDGCAFAVSLPLEGGVAAASVGPATSIPYAGTWESTFGQMILQGSNDLTGPYPSGNGRVKLAVDGHRLSGLWLQPNSAQRCSVEREGTFFWGRLTFVASADGRNLTGTWGYCDTDQGGGAWNANR